MRVFLFLVGGVGKMALEQDSNRLCNVLIYL